MNIQEYAPRRATLRERRTHEVSWTYPVAKRATDIVGALALLVFTGPLIVICALLIMASSPGPAFIRTTRIGKGGRPIQILKLRTMHVDGDRILEDHLKSNLEAARQWNTLFKLRDDPRVIPYFGAFLRKSSIDELPQLIDVLFGRMSLVGPRPFPEYHLGTFDPVFRERRASILPGLTGLWQVECRSSGTLSDQIYWDTKYLEERSYWLDLSILVRTPIVVAVGRSAY